MASWEGSSVGEMPSRRDEPLLRRGERPLLRRMDIHMAASGPGVPRGKTKATGTLFLTTQRLMFMPKKQSDRQLDIELQGILTNKFNQPVFGANNISGTALSQGADGAEGTVKWKFAFYSGGVGTFLNVFLRMLAFVRQDDGHVTVAHASYVATPAVAEVVEQLVGSAAPMDASDPSEVWISDAYVVDSVTNVGDAGYEQAAASAQYATPVQATPAAQEAVQATPAAQEAVPADDLQSIEQLANSADAQHRTENPRFAAANRQEERGQNRAVGEAVVLASMMT